MAALTVGDAAPWFTARAPSRPDFQFSAAAGRYVVLSFLGSAGAPGIHAMLAALLGRHDLFNDSFASLFAVSCDAEDERQRRLADARGFYVFWDPEGKIPELYGLTRKGAQGRTEMARVSFVLDTLLRIVAIVPLRDAESHARDVVAILSGLPPHPAAGAGDAVPPVLVLPRVFEPEFCRLLIGLYETGESADSGFMRTDPVTGQTVLVTDHRLKRRRDCPIDDDAIQKQIQARLLRRLVPELRKVFQFEATRIERYIVACYDAQDRAHFRAHRDNTTKGTAHRRFAVTINLNAEDYEGGDLMFPEFDRRTYRAPTGGAVVFSCGLLHEATAVTKGRRYCFLPFLYDEAAAKIREENLKFLAPFPERTAPATATP